MIKIRRQMTSIHPYIYQSIFYISIKTAYSALMNQSRDCILIFSIHDVLISTRKTQGNLIRSDQRLNVPVFPKLEHCQVLNHTQGSVNLLVFGVKFVSHFLIRILCEFFDSHFLIISPVQQIILFLSPVTRT